MRKTIWAAATVILVMVGVSLSLWAHAEAHAADKLLQRLADAFAKKDLKSVSALINDPWSGQRFCASWDDQAWKAAARALRGAKLKSDSPAKRIYTVESGNRARDITVDLGDGGWRLDYNSFMGPFPHM